MYYLYVMCVLALVATALWAIVCFHYVLQQNRKLNALWGQINQLLSERNRMLGDLQNMWVSPDAPQPDAYLAQLQDLLAQDAATHWQDVEKRHALRQQIDAEAQHVLLQAKSLPQFAQHQQALLNIEQHLADNAAQLVREVDLYNRTVRVHNNLLQVNPNRFIAQRLKFQPAPVYGMSR